MKRGVEIEEDRRWPGRGSVGGTAAQKGEPGSRIESVVGEGPTGSPGSLTGWEVELEGWLEAEAERSDVAHDTEHIRRVVVQAKRLAASEGADLDVVIPAAWLHDIVSVPKHSPQRSSASRLAADEAVRRLREAAYPEERLSEIHHAIEAHSFSAGIEPRTVEARVVQDADRLDALGAVGLSRMLMLGGSMGLPLYDTREPIPITRTPDDRRYAVDHLFCKLLGLAGTMRTDAGRAEAERRSDLLRRYVDELAREAGQTLREG